MLYLTTNTTNKMKPTLALILDTRRKTTTGENAGRFHAKIRVTYPIHTNGKVKHSPLYYKTYVFATRQEFDKIINKPGKNEDFNTKQEKLFTLKNKAKKIIDDHTSIDPASFEMLFTDSGCFDNPLDALLAYSKSATNEGYGEFYNNAYVAFKQFSNGYLTYHQVTKEWLERFEKWAMKSKKDGGRALSIATVGMRATAMRKIFNMGIDQKIIPSDIYPFRSRMNSKGYVIPTKRKRKFALSEEEKDKVLTYIDSDKRLQMHLDFFKFSFLCNGINYADVINLKFKQINGDVIVLERVKSRGKERKIEPITITMLPEAHEILMRHANKSLNPDDFVFPILNNDMTEKEAHKAKQYFIGAANRALKILAPKIGVRTFSTVWARYTFATTLSRAGVAIEIIQKMLGHSTPAITKNYIENIEVTIIRAATLLLLPKTKEAKAANS